MAKIEHLIDTDNGREWLSLYCPGCKMDHAAFLKGFKITWTWNKSLDNPTIRPSLKITWPSPKGEKQCHVVITNGKLHFCKDCTHELKGHIIPMTNVND